jgi:hypothetical protein
MNQSNHPSIYISSEMDHGKYGFRLLSHVGDQKFSLDSFKNKHSLPMNAARKFTNLTEKIEYVCEDNKLRIALKSAPYATEIMFKQEGKWLEAMMHNGALPNDSLMMWFHGFFMLKNIYEIYGMETDFLPEIKFGQNKFTVEVPFPRKKELKKAEGKVKKIKCAEVKTIDSVTQNSIGKITGTIPRIMPSVERNNSAVELATTLVQYAHKSYCIAKPMKMP